MVRCTASLAASAALVLVLIQNYEKTKSVSAFGTSSSNAFLPTTKVRQQLLIQPAPLVNSVSQRRRSTSSTTLCMLKEATGRDGLEELAKDKSPLLKTVRSTPPALRKLVSYGTVPAAAVAGFVLTPGGTVVAQGVGAAITGIVGGIGASRLKAEALGAAKPALAQLLLSSGETLTDDPNLASKVKDLQKEYGLQDDEFMEMATDIYKAYLISMVKNPYTKMAEMNELRTLKDILGLDNVAVGEAHAMAAEEVYRTTCTFTPEEDLDDPEHPDRMSLDKLLFLSERAFQQNGETDEAFVFEFSRVAKCMKLTFAKGLTRVKDVARPFYERALASTRSKLETGQVSPDMLARARTTLGITEEDAKDMHLAAYAEEVKTLLGMDKVNEDDDKATLQFPMGALERLDSLREVLDISEADAQYEISVEVTPLFQAKANEVFEEILSSDEDADVVASWTQLMQRQNELSLTSKTMMPLLDSVVTQTLGSPLEEASVFAGVNNEGGVYTKLNEALQIKSKVQSLLEQSGDLISIDKFYDPDSNGSCYMFLPVDMRKKMYNMYLSKAVRESGGNSTLSEEAERNISQVKTMLGISDYVAGEVATVACGPILEKRLEEAKEEIVGGDATMERVSKLKDEINDLIKNLKISEQVVNKNKQQIYKDYLRFVSSNSPSGIPSKTFAERLELLRQLFSLEKENVVDMHLSAFGTSYKKSIKEAMGVTGVIPKQYREPLETLRDRLGVDASQAKELFHDVIKEKMLPMMKRIEAELERQFLTKQQIAQKRGKDAGEDVFLGGGGASGDLGIGTQGNMMGDIVNLVDFYLENDVVDKVKKDGSEDEEEEVYPVTAIGIKAVEPEMADAMYRQFLVGGFTSQNEQLSKRYEEASPSFGRILGLTKKQMEAIGANVGQTVYENVISNALQKKTSLDQQDMMVLANLQGKLGVTSEQGETMLVDASKKVLKNEANDLFDSPTLTPDDIQSFREKCAGMGLDIIDDLGYSKKRVSALFILEITDGIEKGTITVENPEYISEVQEGLGLTEEDCEEAFANTVTKKVNDALERINKELMRGREDLCLGPIMTIVRFAMFLDGNVDGVNVKEERAYKILGMYDASDFGDATAEVIQNQRRVLTKTLGLDEDE